jgi:hypothetical protein
MRRRFARLAGVFTLALLVGCGAQPTASGLNLAPAAQRAAAAARAPLVSAQAATAARMAGPVAPAPASDPWWRQLLEAPRNAGASAAPGSGLAVEQWWHGVTRDLARQLNQRQRSGTQTLPKVPRSD